MRSDQFLTTLVIDGVPFGAWDALDGGARTAQSNLYKAAGGRTISLGGRPTTEQVTLSRLIEQASGDWDELVRLHGARVGKAMCVATQRPQDEDGNPFGTPLVYRGRLTGVTPPSTNTNEDGEALWSIVIDPEG